jgi:hypothetical protein
MVLEMISNQTTRDSSKAVLKNLDEKRGLFCTPGSGSCSTCPDLQWKVYAVRISENSNDRKYCALIFSDLDSHAEHLGYGDGIFGRILRFIQHSIFGKPHSRVIFVM